MVRYHLLEDLMFVKKMTMQDVADKSNGFLSYDMVQRQLSGKNFTFKDTHIRGWIYALGLNGDQITNIFFSDCVPNMR